MPVATAPQHQPAAGLSNAALRADEGLQRRRIEERAPRQFDHDEAGRQQRLELRFEDLDVRQVEVARDVDHGETFRVLG